MTTADRLQLIVAGNEAIINSRSNIATSIEGKGVAVPEGAKLEDMPPLIDSIEQGGGGGGGGGGTVDREGLAALGYAEFEIDMFQAVCTWSAEDDEFYKVPQWNRDLAGITLAELQSHKDVYYIPRSCLNGLTTLGWRQFYQYRALRLFVSDEVTTFNNESFTQCSSLKGVNLPALTTVSNGFKSSPIQRLIAPNITSVGSSGMEAVALLTLDLPSVDRVENYTFNGASSLVSAKFGSLTYVGAAAFQNCTSLQTLDLTECTEVPTLSNINAFTGASSALKIHVKAVLLEEFKTATNWATYADKFVGI